MSASVMAMRSGLLADWARAAPGASVMSVASRQRRDNAQNLVGGMACAPVGDGDRRARRKRRASMTRELHGATAPELAPPPGPRGVPAPGLAQARPGGSPAPP